MTNLTLAEYALAGGVAGCIADSLMHSLDTIKTRMQGQLAMSSTKKNRYHGIAQSFKLILRQEGIRGLYGGFLACALGSLTSTTIHFGVYEHTKTSLLSAGLFDSLCFFVAGGLGDIFASVAYVPSEVLKTRLQLQGIHNNPYSLSQHNYRGNIHALQSVYAARGIQGLYKGWGATMLRDIPFTAMTFTFYETFKALFLKHRANNEPHRVTVIHDVISGGAAGLLAGFLTTPLDVVKTYLQTQRKNPLSAFGSEKLGQQAQTSVYYNGFVPAFKGILKKSGVKGLFYGVGPRMFWTGSQAMIMFVLYEHLLDMCRYWRMESSSAAAREDGRLGLLPMVRVDGSDQKK